MSAKTSLVSTVTRGVFPHHASWMLHLSLRKLLISPRTLADRLPLTPSSHILEIGPGSGFFSRELADRMPRGRLELFDLQIEMLQKARAKLARHGARNVGYSAGDAARIPYARATFDIVVMVSVLGEVSNAQECVQQVRQVLRPTGFFVCHESLPDPDLIPFGQLVELAQRNGFQLFRRWGRKWNYTAGFRLA